MKDEINFAKNTWMFLIIVKVENLKFIILLGLVTLALN